MEKGLIAHFKKLDWVLIGIVVLLAIIGLISLYSVSLGKKDFSNFQKQIIFLGIGLFLMFVFSCFEWRILKDNFYFILFLYFLCLLALLGLFFFGPTIRGVKAWYKLGPVSIDPIELTKLVLVILLAKYFSSKHIEIHQIRHIFVSGFYVLIPTVLICRQPNLGSALILIILWIGILLVSEIKKHHFLILILIFILIFILSWLFFLKDYQKQRIISFVHSQSVDPLKMGWHQQQAKIAIGNGGLFGQGFNRGSQTQYGFLPESQTDFIFSAIAEEFGLVGIGILFFLIFLFVWRLLKISILSENNFSKFFILGFLVLVVSQTFIHIGMNLGILPIIGLSLPLISYGGSGLIAFFIGLGIIQSIKTH